MLLLLLPLPLPLLGPGELFQRCRIQSVDLRLTEPHRLMSSGLAQCVLVNSAQLCAGCFSSGSQGIRLQSVAGRCCCPLRSRP